MRRYVFLLTLLLALPLPAQQGQAADPGLEQFKRAWQAASRGDRAGFLQIKDGLADFVLYPYLQYEDYRFRRATVDAAEMAAFLDAHADWAFAPGLRRAWLRTLGQKGRWDDLLQYAPGEQDTEIQCFLAQARIQRGDTAQLLSQAQKLWAVGHSQPDACDPVFTWLRKANGITPELAWLRIRRAMEERNPRLTLYLARFASYHDRVWVDRWQQQELEGYRRLDRARQWPDQEKARDITRFGLQYLARHDADLAWTLFTRLDGKIHWGETQRGAILRDIALWSAVASAPDAVVRLHSVPQAARDDSLLEWWARIGLAKNNWSEVTIAVAAMSDELKGSDRWRYWDARARLELGDTDHAISLLKELSLDASYYGFLAADFLGRPYSICPQGPRIGAPELDRFSNQPRLRRVTALGVAGLKDWARREWNLLLNRFNPDELRLAAALASQQGWPDLAIPALARSGDRNWYEWRFPLTFAPLVTKQAGKRGLDAAWVLGLLRAESAMAEDAISPAGARGLMQVSPGTAAQVARRHAYTYKGSEQLLRAEDNILFGTAFLRELMDRFGNNPVLVLGAYNAGPAAVERWQDALPMKDAAVWIENLPYFETRDYIPRVLAFATIYDWRLQHPVRRLASRMPALDSGTMNTTAGAAAFAEVLCPDPKATTQSGK